MLLATLAGDAEVVAQKVALQVGIDPQDVYSEVKPAGKKDVVEQLQAEGRRVAMVGDGFNDTAALAQANVGMAMGSRLSPASEVATPPRLLRVSAFIAFLCSTISDSWNSTTYQCP